MMEHVINVFCRVVYIKSELLIIFHVSAIVSIAQTRQYLTKTVYIVVGYQNNMIWKYIFMMRPPFHANLCAFLCVGPALATRC